MNPTRITVGVICMLAVAAVPAAASRDPWAAGTPAFTYARPDGRVRVHFVTTTADAVLATDADTSGVPDFVEEVAQRGDEVLARLSTAGFRAPLTDGTLGGDDRLDLYLKNLAGADGAFEADSCTDTPFHCVGYVIMENDFAGYSYPSASIGIRVLTSHEIFHAVQEAYDTDQPIAWTEGSAVWAEELIYPEQHDFEDLVSGFLAKPFRPFDRDGAGFGDPYPYGAGLWPYFLEARYSAGIVQAIWERCEDQGSDPTFLTATSDELVARDTTLERAWIEFTRWNARTNVRADATSYPDGQRLALALRDPAVNAPGSGKVIVEGFSARYLPIRSVSTTSRITVTGMRSIAVDVVATAGDVTISRVGDDTKTTVHTFDIVPTTPTAELDVIVTGATIGGLQQEVSVAIAPYDPPEQATDAGCGCVSNRPDAGGALLLAIATLLGRRRSVRRCRARRRSGT